MARLFGFEIKRPSAANDAPRSFVPPVDDEGGINIAGSGFYGSYLDLEGAARSETDLVVRYRDIAQQAEIESAVDEITNEAISADPDDRIVSIVLDDVEISDNLKNRIIEEFEVALKLLRFNAKSYEIFRQWYIDGRLFYHAIVDEKATQEGIKELRYIDPRYIKKVKETQPAKTLAKLDNETIKGSNVKEYFIYSNKGFDTKDYNPRIALKIAKDSIVYVTSGLTDSTNQMVLSYLHKAIKPLNQLRILEDATVIYRISRAPERRIFYIDVGNLPKMKAEQYLRDMMVKHKNRLVYNATTGEIRDDRKMMTMIEDYWIPRREGGRGTQIETLKGGENLGKMEDVEYFQKRLYQSLNIPIDRLVPDTPFNNGNTNEISRDEVKFFKFIQRLRLRFASLFISILEKQLILKNIMTYEDWEAIRDNIRFEFTSDNHFAEMRDADILKERINMANLLEPLLGKYFSEEYVKRHVLRQTDDDIAKLASEMQREVETVAERRIEQATIDGQVQAAQEMAATGGQPQEDSEADSSSGEVDTQDPNALPEFLRK